MTLLRDYPLRVIKIVPESLIVNVRYEGCEKGKKKAQSEKGRVVMTVLQRNYLRRKK